MYFARKSSVVRFGKEIQEKRIFRVNPKRSKARYEKRENNVDENELSSIQIRRDPAAM